MLASGKIKPDQFEGYLHHMWDTAESSYTQKQAQQEALPPQQDFMPGKMPRVQGGAKPRRKQKIASTMGTATVPTINPTGGQAKPVVDRMVTSVVPNASEGTTNLNTIGGGGPPSTGNGAIGSFTPKPSNRPVASDKGSFKKKIIPALAHAGGDLLSNIGSFGGINQPTDQYSPLKSLGAALSDYADDAAVSDLNSGVVGEAYDMIRQLGLENAPEYTQMNLLLRLIDQKNAAISDQRMRRRGM
jgi:hypothetical protein